MNYTTVNGVVYLVKSVVSAADTYRAAGGEGKKR